MRPTAVEGATEALQALEVAKSAGSPFPLLLLDGQTPEMDGFTLSAIGKKEPGTPLRTPIVAMTARAHKGDEDRCLERGMDAYISKPIRSTQLYELLERLPDSHEEKYSTAVATSGDTSALT